MTATLTEHISADEFMELRVHDKGIELVNGEIVEMPMPGMDHGIVNLNIGSILREFIKKNKLGRIAGNDSFIRTGEASVRGADLYYVSYARFPASKKALLGAITPPLELVVEVRSPSDSRKSILAKAREYLAAGVEVALIVDPKDRTATVLRKGKKQEQFFEDDQLTLPDILPGFSVRVGEFFE